MAVRIVLVTCATWPELSTSERCLAAALEARGCQVDVAPWNGPFAPFAGGRRGRHPCRMGLSPGPGRPTGPARAPGPQRTFNSPDLVRWNLSKAHVLELGTRGAPIPRSRLVKATSAAAAQAPAPLRLHEAVLKPAIGASGFGVERARRGDEDAALGRSLARKATDTVQTCSGWRPFPVS